MARRLLKREGMTLNTAQTKKFDDEISYADTSAATPVPELAKATDTVTAPDGSKGAKAPRARRPRNLGVDAGAVDAEGAARAKADEVAAVSIGLSPKPPVYEIGSRVNSTGVANFKRSAEKHEEKPWLTDLSKTFDAQIAAEQRADYLIPASAITVGETGVVHFASPAGQDGLVKEVNALLTERAMFGLASRVTPGGAKYLAPCPPALRAANLNHWLKQRGETELTLRTRNAPQFDGRLAEHEIFAACGPKYAAHDVDQVMRQAAEQIGHNARGTVRYDGYRMTLDAIFHTNVEPKNAVAGEFFKGLIRMKAADDGSGSINVSLGLWRNLCLNLIIIDFAKVLVGKRAHIGVDTIAEDVAELMKVANERIGLIVGKWSDASAENILERYDLGDADAVIRGLVLNGAVKAPGVKSEDMITRLRRAWEKEPGYSKTAFLNAITRCAHSEEWRSWEDAEELESTAGELLYQPVWNLDVSEKTAEQLLA
jgi:hypothetical protein